MHSIYRSGVSPGLGLSSINNSCKYFRHDQNSANNFHRKHWKGNHGVNLCPGWKSETPCSPAALCNNQQHSRRKYVKPRLWDSLEKNNHWRIQPVSATAAAQDVQPAEKIEPSIPKTIEDISNGDHILGYGAELGEDHPGFHDDQYKRRRAYITDLAKQHKIGDPIPRLQYSAEETGVWQVVLNKLWKLYPACACAEFLDSLPSFGFQPDQIPQLQDLSEILRDKTGWQIRPVAGLLHPRDFLNGLAFRYFHSTQYIRHHSNPMYTPEPDVCHEILGHVPMLANPDFAELAQLIGLASLGASEKEIWHLTKLYWYTVEFGTILENGQVRAFGAGLLSSYGELEWMRQGANGQMPKFAALDPFKKLPKMSYKDGFQKTYFLCSSFHDASSKLRAYAGHMHQAKDFHVLQ